MGAPRGSLFTLATFLVALVLCVPLWLVTCQVEKHSLPTPLTSSSSLDALHASVASIRVRLVAASPAPVAVVLEAALHEAAQWSVPVHVTHTPVDEVAECLRHSADDVDLLWAADATAPDVVALEQVVLGCVYGRGHDLGRAHHVLLWADGRDGDVGRLVVGQTRLAWVRVGLQPDRAVWERVAKQLAHTMLDTDRVLTDEQREARKAELSIRHPMSARLTLSFTLLQERAVREQVWDLERALVEPLDPLLDDLSPICSLSIDSHVRSFGNLSQSLDLQHNAEHGHHFLSSKLRNFASSTRWNLESPLSDDTIEFVVYVPDREHMPVHVVDEPSNTRAISFIVPRWGGVVIHNSMNVSAASLRPTLDLIGTQLRAILGLSPERGNRLADWELDMLARRHWQRGIDSFKSLSKQLAEMPDIPVAPQIVRDASDALALLQRCTTSCDPHRDARDAADKARRVLFDKSMLPQLYFPQDHLFAVLAPFFVPVVLHLVGTAAKHFATK